MAGTFITQMHHLILYHFKTGGRKSFQFDELKKKCFEGVRKLESPINPDLENKRFTHELIHAIDNLERDGILRPVRDGKKIWTIQLTGAGELNLMNLNLCWPEKDDDPNA